MSSKYLLLAQVWAGAYMFWYSFNQDQLYQDLWWVNLTALLMILLSQLLGSEEVFDNDSKDDRL
jgi:hypothetical protein